MLEKTQSQRAVYVVPAMMVGIVVLVLAGVLLRGLGGWLFLTAGLLACVPLLHTAARRDRSEADTSASAAPRVLPEVAPSLWLGDDDGM